MSWLSGFNIIELWLYDDREGAAKAAQQLRDGDNETEAQRVIR
jgi:hypothetical protein